MNTTKLPPGPPGLPLIGHLLSMTSDPLTFLPACARRYGDIVGLRMFGRGLYVLGHPDHIEYVLRGNHRNFIKDKWTRVLKSLTGEGLITSENDFWRRQRQMAQPAFRGEQIQGYAGFMVDYTQQMLAKWRDGQALDVHAEMTHLTLSIVARALFDMAVDRAAEEVGQALEAGAAFFQSPISVLPGGLWLPFPVVLRYHRAVAQLNRIVYGLIRQRREQPGQRDDLLSCLLAARDEAGGQMTDQQIRDELLTLFLAGHETTALTLTFTFYLLAKHPAVADRLAQEIDEVLAGRPPTPADVPRLRYTGWVIHEVLRLYPPAWSIGREAVADCEIGGYPVPRGTQLSMVQWSVHRDPRWFDDPELFRPERWDNDLIKRLPRCAYFPFGDGPRICIGNHFAMLEGTLLLATITQRVRLALLETYQLRLVPAVTLRPRDGMPMVVHQRPGKA